jgi:hypothetical protein
MEKKQRTEGGHVTLTQALERQVEGALQTAQTAHLPNADRARTAFQRVRDNADMFGQIVSFLRLPEAAQLKTVAKEHWTDEKQGVFYLLPRSMRPFSSLTVI